MHKNPFEVLGITPKMVKELEDQALYNLVKACYRALQRSFHPDLTPGGKEKAVEINLAFEALDLERDPESFYKYKKAYVKRLSRKTKNQTIDQLQEKVAFLSHQQDLLINNYWNHLLEIYHIKRSSTLFPQNPRQLKISLLDVSLKFNISFRDFGGRLVFKDILFDPSGHLYYRFPKKKRFQPVRFITLLGCIPRNKIEIWKILLKRSHCHSWEVLNIVDQEVFKKDCLPLLKPKLLEDAYLFSFRQKASSQSLEVCLEGMIVKIKPARTKDFQKIKLNSSFLKALPSPQDLSP